MNLAIDLGTSYTKIGMLEETGAFINLVGAESMIPTVAAYVPRTGRLYFGAAAANLRETGMRVGKFFKIEIKRNPGYRLGPYRLPDILAYFLEYVRDEYVAGRMKEVTSVAICVPNYFGLKARRVVLEAACRAFPATPVRLVLEPLAALAGLWQEREPARQPLPSGDIMVVDIGGGTADISFVHVSRGTGTGMTLEAQLHAGSDAFSGSEVDRAILRHVLFPRFELQTGQHIPAVFREEKGMSPEEEYQYARMLGWAEEIKLKIDRRRHVRVDLPDFYQGRSLCLDLTEEELASALENTLASLRQFLEARVKPRARQLGLYGKNGYDLDLVVLMGGSARLKGVKTVMAEIGTEIWLPPEPEFYVVKGLSYLGAPQGRETGPQMKGIVPFRFYIEKRAPGKADTNTLEPVPFDTANLELDPSKTYRIFSVPCDSAYNLGREQGLVRFRMYQGEAGEGDEPGEIRTDTESLVLDTCQRREDVPGDEVDIYLDLPASCLKTSLDGGEGLESPGDTPAGQLWQQALARQQQMVSSILELDGERYKALETFASQLEDLRGDPAYSYQNYEALLIAKLLAFFAVLQK